MTRGVTRRRDETTSVAAPRFIVAEHSGPLRRPLYQQLLTVYLAVVKGSREDKNHIWNGKDDKGKDGIEWDSAKSEPLGT